MSPLLAVGQNRLRQQTVSEPVLRQSKEEVVTILTFSSSSLSLFSIFFVACSPKRSRSFKQEHVAAVLTCMTSSMGRISLAIFPSYYSWSAFLVPRAKTENPVYIYGIGGFLFIWLHTNKRYVACDCINFHLLYWCRVFETGIDRSPLYQSGERLN